MSNKIGPNDKCHCGSDKKYKKCCFLQDEQQRIIESTYVETDRFKEGLEILKSNFPNITFQNVSEKLNSKSYTLMQLQHMKDNVCLLAERFKTNEKVFKDRDPNNNEYDFIMMYRGAYRILFGGPNLKAFTISLKSFFANPSYANYEPNENEKE